MKNLNEIVLFHQLNLFLFNFQFNYVILNFKIFFQMKKIYFHLKKLKKIKK